MKAFATTAILLLSIILKSLINSSKMKIQLLTLAFSVLVFWGSWGQSLEWVKGMGGEHNDYGKSIAIDKSGNVYTAGIFYGTVDFDPGIGTYNLTSNGYNNDIYILKLDSLGNFIWAKRLGGGSNDYVNSITLDTFGNVYTIGSFDSWADFDPGVNVYYLTASTYNNLDVFISKLDSSGNFVWAKSIGGLGEDNGLSISIDESCNVYTTGIFRLTADFDPGAGTNNLTSEGNSDIFISKLDSSGNFIWAKRIGGTYDVWVRSIGIDAFSNVYITGYFKLTADFNPGAGIFNLSSEGEYDVFVTKLDSLGNFIWAKQIGGINYEYVNSLAIDVNNNVCIIGYFNGTADFNPDLNVTYNLTSGTYNPLVYNTFISKLDSLGNFIWAKQIGGANYVEGTSIALDVFGNVYTTGFFSLTADFDPGVETYNLTSESNSDIFISKLDSSGNFVWAKHMGTWSDNDYFIAIDVSCNVYTTGRFNNTTDFDPDLNETINLTSQGYDDIFILKLKQKVVTGYVYNEINPNCIKDSNEVGLQNRFVIINPGNFIAQTSESGKWVIDKLTIGTYTATLDTSGNWSPTCPVTQTFTVTNPNEITFAPDFGLVSTQPCASPDISVNMPIVRRCFSNQKVYVNTCNQYVATGALSAAYADVELDSLIIPQSASLAYTSLGNNTYRFQLGPLNPGQCVNFTIDCQVSCDAILGQTLCLEANLYPADSCVFDTIPEPYPGDFTPCTLPWDKSSLQVEGYCQNDSIYFVITNTGTFGNGDMDCFSPVRIFIDGVYTFLDSIKLVGGDSIVFVFAGDGRTWRLEADQHPLHPGNSHPNATVEACGNLANWTSDLVNILPQDDADPIVDIYCGVVTGSYDPNDKTGYPIGVTENHYVYPNQQLQYTIRFQNTGTDTAFTVIVRDTLDMDLDIFSVVPGVASNTFNFQMYGPRVLEWTFYNIQLPDSNHSEPNSHGFCTFTVNQNPNLANNTEIRNSADIYFDYNEPVITNQTLHTVYEFRQPLSYSDTVYVNDTVCDSYFYNGLTYNNTGTYYQTNNDTLTILNITIKDSTVLNLSVISCINYELNGIVYDSTGIYKQILVNSVGCDSIINLDLYIPPKYNIDTSLAICQGDSLIFGTQILKTSGNYTEPFTSVFGCDSVVTLNLSVNTPSSSITNITACDSYTWTDGNTYTSSGTFSQILVNTVGCDSVATLDLILGVSTSSTTSITACDSYTWTDGNTYTSSGTYTQTLTSSVGCDSVATLDLILGVSTSSTTNVTTCDSFTWTDGNTYTSSGTYSQTLTNSVGCDSIAILILSLDNVYIPDANFKAALVGNSAINTNGDNEIQCYEAANYNGIINVKNLNISDLTGIEAFSEIIELNCNINNLTNLNVSNNINLTRLECGLNQLSNLDLSNNISLIYLVCSNNQLTSLDVSLNTNLFQINCSNNKLTSLDVSANVNLDYLECQSNYLAGLNILGSTNLTYLECANNQLSSLNISGNNLLEYLGCDNNQIVNLDVSTNQVLNELICGANQITNLDFSNNPKLRYLDCYNNKLSNLNISSNTLLEILYCFNNSLINLNASANNSLIALSCDSNQLEILNIKNGNNINLNLTALSNPNLTCIQVDNPIWSASNWTYIDPWASFSDNCYLGENIISNNHTEINIYPNPTDGKFYISVEGLQADGNIEIIDVTGKTVFTEILTKETRLKQVDFSNLPKGIYAVKVTSGDVVKVSRIVVQ